MFEDVKTSQKKYDDAVKARKDYLIGKASLASAGLYGDDLKQASKPLAETADAYAQDYANYKKSNRYFGDNLLGAFLNP